MEEEGKMAVEQWKKITVFTKETIGEQVTDPKLHPVRLSDINVTDYGQIRSKVLLLDEGSNLIYVFGKNVEGSWTAHTEATLHMLTNNNTYNQVVVTYGQDVETQMKSIYVKLWYVPQAPPYEQMKPKRSFLIGKLGEPQRIVTAINILFDLSILVVGTRRGTLTLFQSRHLMDNDSKASTKSFEKKEIKSVKAVRRGAECDVYFSNDEALCWLQNLNQKRRLLQAEVEIMEATRTSLMVSYRHDPKNIYQYVGGKEVRVIPVDGQKTAMREFRGSYLVAVVFEKKSEKTEKSVDKHHVHILDTVNQYAGFNEAFVAVQALLVSDTAVTLITRNGKGERQVVVLSEKDNSAKIEMFFSKSFYSEAYRFAKNQNCHDSLLARICQLHGDMLYSKREYAPAIKQYIATIGHLQASYVIRKFLQVTQIDYLIEYLQKIHEKKVAKKEHTALLLNCYVKKQKIEHLSTFLSESSLQSDLFDIETAIKVCKDLTHYEEALKLAEQKHKHELYLKILIENKKDYEKALEYIHVSVPLEEKEKCLLEFGQEFMKFLPKQTIDLIKLLLRAQSLSQLVKGKERDYVLASDERAVLHSLNHSAQDLSSLTVITFKKPDEYFRLFISNTQQLEDFLIFLNRDVAKLPNEEVVSHRLIEFYLQMMKESPSRHQQFSDKILFMLQEKARRMDDSVLLSLFKMYDFDEGIIWLCRKLGMRDDLLNFYISKARDKDILDLCKQHGREEVNLWIHALKYFVKPQSGRQHNVPEVLAQLAKIPNLSPLPVLTILSKNKFIEYNYVKSFFLMKLKEDRASIERDQQVVRRNLKKADESRAELKKLKTTAKQFVSNICSSCQNGLAVPSIYFMCGHAFHENCLGGDRECLNCRFDMRSVLERKDRFAEGALDQAKLFETLQEHKENAFDVVSEYLGKGMFAFPPA